MKNKKAFLKMGWVIVIIIITLLVIIGILLALRPKPASETPVSEETAGLVQQIPKEVEEYAKERELKCMRGDKAYISCLAEVHGDISFCETFEDEKIKEICRDFFFTEPCEKMINSDMKNSCIAEEKNDASYCEKIKDDDSKNICLVIITGEEKYCGSLLTEQGRQICRNTFLPSWPDESLCIKDTECYDQVYFDAATIAKYLPFCDKIADIDLKNDCTNKARQ